MCAISSSCRLRRAIRNDETIKKLTPGPEIGLLSVDIDGNDYYILRAIDSVSPRVIVAQYNAKFPPDVFWVMEYNETHRWDATDYFGSSLKALETLLREKGYSLVGCNLLGCNAFFVRNDLASDPPFCSPFTAENHYEPARYFLLPSYDAGFPGDLAPSASRIGRKFLHLPFENRRACGGDSHNAAPSVSLCRCSRQ